MTTLSDGVVLTHVTTDVVCILKGIDRDWHGVVIFSSTATYSSMARRGRVVSATRRRRGGESARGSDRRSGYRGPVRRSTRAAPPRRAADRRPRPASP